MCPRVLPLLSVAYPKTLGYEHLMDRLKLISQHLGDGSGMNSYSLSVPSVTLRLVHGDTRQKTEFRPPECQQMSSSQDHPAPLFCSSPTVSGKAIPAPCQGSLLLPADFTWHHQDSALNCAAVGAPTAHEVPSTPCTSRHRVGSPKSSV